MRALDLEQLVHEPRPLLGLAGLVVAERGQHQALLGAGHGHVEEPPLLLDVGIAVRLGPLEQLHGEPALGAVGGGPLALEQVGDHHDGELEPLRLVEGHQPDALHVLRELNRGGQLAAGPLVRIQVGEEVRQGAAWPLRLPVRCEAHQAADVDHPSLGLQRAGGEQVQERSGPLQVARQDGVGPLAEGQRTQLVEHLQEPAQLCPRLRRDPRGPLVHLAGLVRGLTIEDVLANDAGAHDAPHGVDHVRPVERCVPGHPQDLNRIQPPRPRGHDPDQRGIVQRVRHGAQSALGVADLGKVEQRQAAHDGERDPLVLELLHDGIAVPVLAVQDGDRVPGGSARLHRVADVVRPGLPWSRQGGDRVRDRDRLVLVAVADVDLDGQALVPLRDEALGGVDAAGIGGDQTVGAGEHMAHGAEVLADDGLAGQRVWRHTGGVGGRAREPGGEVLEGVHHGAAEVVDGLVVVAHDHHVVRPVRRPPQQLDQLDLGGVGVLELVHQDVAVLALPPAQQVGPLPEDGDDVGDLLREVQRPALRQRLLVPAIDRGHLTLAHDLQRRAVPQVRVRQRRHQRLLLRAELLDPHRPAVPRDRPARLPVRRLGGCLRVVRLGRQPGLLPPLPGAALLVVLGHRAQRFQAARCPKPVRGRLVAPVRRLVDRLLVRHERVEVVHADELVLGPVDEAHEVRERPVRVVEQVQVRAKLPQQQHLAGAVQHRGQRRQLRLAGESAQDAMAEAVEVLDRHARANGRSHARRLVQSVLELRRRLGVVRHHQQLLRDQRPLERVAVGGHRLRRHIVQSAARAHALRAVRLQQPAHPLHDHARLARARPGEHHHRPVGGLHDGALLIGERIDARCCHACLDLRVTGGRRRLSRAYPPL